ncbi:lytic murein transglycosylase [Cognatishimia activa]|uniref:Membrane-bound lytic murein transglycosylase B n=1 Tax=Cognatishimia activa TaxID=1715691 RepID=A0A0P1ILZ5_9RHOB|nr:Membrane-bound lytic murein transglycosylase B precursor [Cognatishimia activa]CUK24691.1 Membrane-bound lytic murein transglycosylase B precursor [Cognatishimia activa]
MVFKSTLRALICAFALSPASGFASAPETSLRPVLRAATSNVQVETPVIMASVSVQSSMRPVLRPEKIAPQVTQANARFQAWIRSFKTRAARQGISKSVLDRAFRGVQYNADVVRRDRNQSEFTKTLWEYLDSAASDSRVKNGKAALRKHRRKLEAIERQYGVDKEVVVAVWGLESAYGAVRGDTPIIEALATLAFDGRRGRFFEQQLIAALKILQNGDTTPRNMVGSWAGAMGHTQFIPTSYLAFAVDFTGDGKRDIWSDDPSDALASTAAYLKRSGWVTGQPWGVEVTLPRGFNYALANRKIKKSPSQWGALGVKGLDGRSVKNYGQASLLLPAGSKGAAFLIFKNFDAIERYNTADAYVIGVGHLSDRIKGGGKFQSRWPREDRALTFSERKELQRRLTAAGFDTVKIDGKIGPLTIDAVRAYQRSEGLEPDGYASLAILKRLR